MVEKVCELGVARIRWLRTVRCEGRVPRHDKALAWAQMAMEQSRRSHLTEIDSDWTRISDLSGHLVALDREGDRLSRVSAPVTLLVGPEGGWDPSEVPPAVLRVTLGDSVLRTETAAIVGAHAIVSALS
jgi:16S rRNA (uracil1498-N3)-methyltransferase